MYHFVLLFTFIPFFIKRLDETMCASFLNLGMVPVDVQALDKSVTTLKNQHSLINQVF